MKNFMSLLCTLNSIVTSRADRAKKNFLADLQKAKDAKLGSKLTPGTTDRIQACKG
jgi:hypothetical protein